jgi:hypothetical protein
MDEHRRIRFYVAPLLLITSLLWGALFDSNYQTHIVDFLKNTDNLSKLIGFAATGSLVVFAFGYLIGTVTYFIMTVLFRVFNIGYFFSKSRFHEVCLSDNTLVQLWHLLLNDRNAKNKSKRKYEFYATVVFDYGLLATSNPELHQWLVRRWSAISMNSSATVGLIFSLILGHLNPVVPIAYELGWCIPVTVLAFMFAVVGFFAWCDTKQMLTFTIKMTEPQIRAQVRLRAHELWENANRPEGTALANWLQAEATVADEASRLLNMVGPSK